MGGGRDGDSTTAAAKLTEEIACVVRCLFVFSYGQIHVIGLYLECHIICLHGVIQYIDQTCLNFRVCSLSFFFNRRANDFVYAWEVDIYTFAIQVSA